MNRFDPDFALGARGERQQCVDQLRVAELAQRPDHDGYCFGITGLKHFGEPRDGLFAADFGKRIDRALADPPVVVMGRLNERLDRTLVFCLIEDFDGRAANVFVLVADELQDRVDDLRAADFAERVGRPAAYPPVAILERFQEIFDRSRVPDLVQHLDGRASRVLVLVLQDLDQIADRVRMVRLGDDIDRLVLDVDLRILQQRADPLDIDRTIHSLQCRQGGTADQLVGILQQPLKRGLHLGGVETRQDVDDVHPGDRVLAVHAAQELAHRVVVRDIANYPEEGRFLVRLLRVGRIQQLTYAEARLLGSNHFEYRGLCDAWCREGLEQEVWRIVTIAGQRPGNPRDDPWAALDEAFDELREGFQAHQAGKHFDERHCGVFVGVR